MSLTEREMQTVTTEREATDEMNDAMTHGLTRMARIEVVVDGEHVPTIRDLLLEAGATGYTALNGVAGFGHSGEHSGRLLFNDRNSLSMVISVVAPERVGEVMAGVRGLLDHHHGVVFVSETYVSRPEYFQSVGSASA